MAQKLTAKFENAAKESTQPTRSNYAQQWGGEPEKPLPPTHVDGKPSAGGMKAKFEQMANPPPPQKTMGSVAWKDERDQGKKKMHVPGQDPTKPPPPRSLDSLP